jgi:hypothetical protein
VHHDSKPAKTKRLNRIYSLANVAMLTSRCSLHEDSAQQTSKANRIKVREIMHLNVVVANENAPSAA